MRRFVAWYPYHVIRSQPRKGWGAASLSPSTHPYSNAQLIYGTVVREARLAARRPHGKLFGQVHIIPAVQIPWRPIRTAKSVSTLPGEKLTICISLASVSFEGGKSLEVSSRLLRSMVTATTPVLVASALKRGGCMASDSLVTASRRVMMITRAASSLAWTEARAMAHPMPLE